MVLLLDMHNTRRSHTNPVSNGLKPPLSGVWSRGEEVVGRSPHAPPPPLALSTALFPSTCHGLELNQGEAETRPSSTCAASTRNFSGGTPLSLSLSSLPPPLFTHKNTQRFTQRSGLKKNKYGKGGSTWNFFCSFCASFLPYSLSFFLPSS